MELKAKIVTLEKERDTLKQNLDDLKSSPPTSIPAEEPPSSDAAEHLVHEERLKWQVEMVNTRRELDGKLEKEKCAWAKEREGLKQEAARLEKELVHGKSAYQQVGKLQAQLEMSQQRWVCKDVSGLGNGGEVGVGGRDGGCVGMFRPWRDKKTNTIFHYTPTYGEVGVW